MILDALSNTAADLLTGLLIVAAASLVISAIVVAVLGLGIRREEAKRRRAFEDRLDREMATLDTELPECLRVIGGSQRGPDAEPRRKHG